MNTPKYNKRRKRTRKNTKESRRKRTKAKSRRTNKKRDRKSKCSRKRKSKCSRKKITLGRPKTKRKRRHRIYTKK